MALEVLKDKAYTYNMSVFYRILLPIMGIILFIGFIFVLFNSPNIQGAVLRNINVASKLGSQLK